MARLAGFVVILVLIGCKNPTGSTSNEENAKSTAEMKPERIPDRGHLNICVFGYQDDAHLNLSAGFQRLFSTKDEQTAAIERLATQADQGILFLEFDSQRNHYAQLVIPPKIPLRQLFPTLASMDVVVLLVGKDGKVDDRGLIHLRMGSAAGVNQVAIVRTDEASRGVDDDALAQLAASAGFSNTPLVIDGDVDDQKSIGSLIESIDNKFFARRPSSHRFLMPIDDVFSIAGRGTVVTGRIESGSIRKGEVVDLIGNGQRRSVRVSDLEFFRGKLDSAEAGDHVGVLVEQVTKNDVARGFLLTDPGELTLTNRFDATLNVHPNSLPSEFSVLIRTAELRASLTPSSRTTDTNLGSSVTLQLAEPHGVEAGIQFVLLKDDEFLGAGTITSVVSAADE